MNKTITFYKAIATLLLLSSAAAPAGPATDAPPLRIQVDPRVELISTIFRFAGNPEYSQGRVPKYTDDVEKQLGPFRDHAVVKLARELRGRRGVSFDACMSMAVHLHGIEDLTPIVPLAPWPDGLDKRWTVNDANRFLAAAREFVADSSFLKFLEQHRALYQTTEGRLKTLMDKEGHLEWFKEYFGERPGAAFTIAPALLNGGSCYGAHCLDSSGKDNLYCMLGVWQTDSEGLPEFTKDMLTTIVHEFGHSYANPVIDRHSTQLQSAADILYRQVSARMRSQAYGNSQTMMRESLVRVCEARYAFRYDGEAAGRRAISGHKSRGFLWMEELSKLFADYEAHRDQYPNLDAFSPRLVTFFNDYARNFAERQKSAEGNKPKVVSITPANGAADVDPALSSIRVVFDRPMADGSWAFVGGGAHCPETKGEPGYDQARTTWTVPVKLRPDWSYTFMLNSERFQGFHSEEGVPLEPVNVNFKTGAERQR